MRRAVGRRIKGRFAKLKRLTPELTKKIPRRGGVYKIVCPRIGKWSHGIRRFKKTDKHRILAYGQSRNLRNRANAFLASLRRPDRHHEGNLLRILNERAGLNIPYVLIAWELRSGHKAREERLIKEYVQEYGEVPPLNAAIPKREKASGW